MTQHNRHIRLVIAAEEYRLAFQRLGVAISKLRHESSYLQMLEAYQQLTPPDYMTQQICQEAQNLDRRKQPQDRRRYTPLQFPTIPPGWREIEYRDYAADTLGPIQRSDLFAIENRFPIQPTLQKTTTASQQQQSSSDNEIPSPEDSPASDEAEYRFTSPIPDSMLTKPSNIDKPTDSKGRPLVDRNGMLIDYGD